MPEQPNTAPEASVLTTYDEQHPTTYLHPLDADAAYADWEDAAKIILKLDPKADEARARKTQASRLARAHWLTNSGHRQLLRGGAAG
jgi:hypothetical protein